MNTPHLQPKHSIDEVEQGEILPDPLPQTQPEPPPLPQATPFPLASVKPPAKPAFNSKDMASLAGLDLQADPVASAIVATEQEENIDAAKTQLPIYKQSVFKTITIGSSFFIAVVCLGKLVFPNKDEPVVAQKAPTPIEQSKAEFAPDPRFGVVNSKLAMNDQSKQIMDAASAQQTLANQKPGSGAPVANTAPAPATNPSKVDSNPEVVKNTAPPANSEYQAPPPIATAPAQPVAIAPKPVAPAQPLAAAPKPLATPQPIAVIPRPRIAPVVRPPIQIAARQIQLPAPQPITPAKVQVTWDVANRNAVGLWNWRTGDAAVAATVPTIQNSTSAKPKLALTRTIPAAVGQQIKSKLVVPYQSPTSAPTQLIFIGLSTPVLDIRGEVLLPAGTQIMCEVAAMDNGMLQVFNAKASIDGQLIELPKQSIILQDAGKQPLVAQLKTFGQGEVFNRDLYTIAGGMANAIGQNLTQPQTQTIASAGGIVQSTSPSVNLTGAALSGFAPVVSQWMQRNQSAITQINAAAKIWFLPTGTDLNLVIAQPFTL
jgi:Bacterial conjugation TrbI-like protein